MQEHWEVISKYTDEQAVDDGVLVPVVAEGGVNRVTRAVYGHFVKPAADPSETGREPDLSPLLEVIGEMVKIPPDKDGWRTGFYQGLELWLLPNEVGGVTLMFPEDY